MIMILTSLNIILDNFTLLYCSNTFSSIEEGWQCLQRVDIENTGPSLAGCTTRTDGKYS